MFFLLKTIGCYEHVKAFNATTFKQSMYSRATEGQQNILDSSEVVATKEKLNKKK